MAKFNGKSKRSNRKGDRKMDSCNSISRGQRDESREERYPRDAKNDISWYSRFPNLLLAAGSFPYPYRPGMVMNLGSATDGAATPTAVPRNVVIPGVMALDWAPSVGVSNQATDPASVACKEIYAKVRDAYSGSLDADAPDFMMYLMSLDSIFSYIAWLKRIYRVMNTWTPDNYVVPDVLLSAMGLGNTTVQNLRANRTQLWQAINTLVLQSRKFTCPAIMDVFNRHYWMSDNVYTDAGTINSQFYIFNLKKVFQYAAVPIPGDSAGNTAAGLTMLDVPRGNNVEAFLNFGLSLINALVAWDDAYTINGYLARAFQGVPQFQVAELELDERLTPVYEEEVLTQIENSRTVTMGGSWTNGQNSGMTVAQNPLTNAVISNPTITVGVASTVDYGALYKGGYTRPPILSIRSDAPTVADSVIASRLQAITDTSKPASGNNWTLKIKCGTEVPIAWRMLTGSVNASGSVVYGDIQYRQDIVSTDGTIPSGLLYQILNVPQFDWHPFAVITVQGDGSTVTGFMGDTHNTTTITFKDLENLHTVCLYSEFNAFAIN